MAKQVDPAARPYKEALAMIQARRAEIVDQLDDDGLTVLIPRDRAPVSVFNDRMALVFRLEPFHSDPAWAQLRDIRTHLSNRNRAVCEYPMRLLQDVETVLIDLATKEGGSSGV